VRVGASGAGVEAGAAALSFLPGHMGKNRLDFQAVSGYNGHMENDLRRCSIQGNGQTHPDGSQRRSGDSESTYHQQQFQGYFAVRDVMRPEI